MGGATYPASVTTSALRNANPAKTKADAVVVGLQQRRGQAEVAPGGEEVAQAYGRSWRPLLATLAATGKAGEVLKVPTSRTIGSPVLVLVGLGEVAEGQAQVDAVRRAAGVAARAVPNAASVALALPAGSAELVAAATEGFLLGAYRFTTYQSKPDTTGIAELVVCSTLARRKEVVTAFEEAQVLTAAVATTRDWVNTPPGDLTPPAFADAVVEAAKAHRKEHSRRGQRVEVTVLDDAQLAELGCGGLLGVGAGSSAPPRLVELRYTSKDARTHLALVGKGITFDSGGLTIKPAASMGEMKSDMAGAAAVVQAVLAIAALELPITVTAYAAMAENMLSGDALRPGDVLTIYGGTTVEVQNTDAEGRLVLADALVRATEQEPDVIVDVATLTGAMVVALGDQVAGVMGTDEVVGHVLDAARDAGEQAWPMPIPEQMSERIHSSKVADLAQHDWVRWGGGLFAAAFLREFTAGRPWAHVDIAGPSFNSGGPRGHVTSGGTGYGVTTLVELARRLSA
ncbi:leucyl aminopeptidase [Nocardioides nanhaiensis]|uniref:Probable cytosol aminopeptidase n=1 Tax=Nocardioides nanhaiensis TaxID=1476871 RepID=A0ABP8X2R7_9ACTN